MPDRLSKGCGSTKSIMKAQKQNQHSAWTALWCTGKRGWADGDKVRNRDRLSDHVQHTEGIVHSIRRTGAEMSTEDISGSPGDSRWDGAQCDLRTDTHGSREGPGNQRLGLPLRGRWSSSKLKSYLFLIQRGRESICSLKGTRQHLDFSHQLTKTHIHK